MFSTVDRSKSMGPSIPTAVPRRGAADTVRSVVNTTVVPVPGFQASAQGTWAETSGLEVGGRPLALWPFADLPVSTRRNPHPCNIQGQLLSRNSSFVTFTQVGSQHLSLSLDWYLESWFHW